MVGSLAGLVAGLDGSIAFFLPVAALAAAAGIVVRRHRPHDASIAPWFILLAFATFVIAVVADGGDISEWPDGLEMRYIGMDFCGNLICMGQTYATSPLIAAMAYALAQCGGTPVVVGTVLFAVSWLGLSAATQRPSAIAHLSPYWGDGEPAPPEVWCRTSAAPEYIALPPPAKLARATAFYDSTLSPLLRRSYFDAGGYRQTFLTASVESPIQLAGLPPWDFTYREISAHGYPRRAIGRLTRDAAGIALVGTVAVLSALWLRGVRRGSDGGQTGVRRTLV